MSVYIRKMSKRDFLAILTAITIHRRLNPPRVSGCTPTAFSDRFCREGHWDGGPGFIRTKEVEHGKFNTPICEACRFLTGKEFPPEDWRSAAKKIGLRPKLAEEIFKACELSPYRDQNLYRRILIACNLPYGDDDNEGVRPKKS